MVSVLDLITELKRRGVYLDVVATDDGVRLQTDAPPGAVTPELAEGVRTHRNPLVAIILGRRTGHLPAPCSKCGEISMVSTTTPAGRPRSTWPPCRLTPGCDGRHRPLADRKRAAS